MKKRNRILKEFVLIVYVLLSGVYLWLFSILAKPEFSLFSYFITTALVYSAGIAYHVLTTLYETPLNKKNAPHWKKMAMWMLFSLLSYAVASCMLNVLVQFYKTAIILAIFIMFLSHFMATYFAQKAEKVYKEKIKTT